MTTDSSATDTGIESEPEPRGPGRLPSRKSLIAVGAGIVVIAVVVGLVVFGPAADDAPPTGGDTDAPVPERVESSGGADAGVPEPEINFGELDPVPAPAFELTSFDGEPVTNATLTGKPTVLNVWASWCVPCREEMPAFNDVFNEFGGAVNFLGVAFDDTEPAARAFADEIGVDYTLALDADGFVDELGLLGMPSTYFLDSEGNIVEALYGPRDAAQLGDTLKSLFPQLA